MDEKRSAKRLDLDVVIELSRIDDDNDVTTVKMESVEVADLSRNGIGFR